jgi:hypothetical protein
MKLDSFAAGALSALVLAALLGARPVRATSASAPPPTVGAASTAVLLTNSTQEDPLRVAWRSADQAAIEELAPGETILFSLVGVTWVKPDPGVSFRPY